MTGLTDPMDDFYSRHPELVDLDRALEDAHACADAVRALAERDQRRSVGAVVPLVAGLQERLRAEAELEPGDVVRVELSPSTGGIWFVRVATAESETER